MHGFYFSKVNPYVILDTRSQGKINNTCGVLWMMYMWHDLVKFLLFLQIECCISFDFFTIVSHMHIVHLYCTTDALAEIICAFILTCIIEWCLNKNSFEELKRWILRVRTLIFIFFYIWRSDRSKITMSVWHESFCFILVEHWFELRVNISIIVLLGRR